MQTTSLKLVPQTLEEVRAMVEIAFGVAPDYQGKGYATEAAQALTAYAFDSGKVRVVRAHTRPEPNVGKRSGSQKRQNFELNCPSTIARMFRDRSVCLEFDAVAAKQTGDDDTMALRLVGP